MIEELLIPYANRATAAGGRVGDCTAAQVRAAAQPITAGSLLRGGSHHLLSNRLQKLDTPMTSLFFFRCLDYASRLLDDDTSFVFSAVIFANINR